MYFKKSFLHKTISRWFFFFLFHYIVGAYDQKSREHYGHVMHLQENNNVLIVLEKQKDNKNDYVSIFDMNDNGSAAFSEKIDKRGTISLTCVNDK